MADTKKKGFKTIETNYQEYDEQIRSHRIDILKRAIKIIVLVVILVIAVILFMALRSYDSYEIKSSLKRSNSGATKYAQFEGYLLEYSKDGISCFGEDEEIYWNQSFEMINPVIEFCGEYFVIYDAGGTELYILAESGLVKSIETSSPIQKVCIAKQGTVAVLMKEDKVAQVKLFDKKGKELASGKFYEEKGGFPVDIALSYDATKLAVDMVDISQGGVNTTISFYNFGSVGQSEIDNNVGSYTFEGIFVPEIAYLSDSQMIGLGTGKILVFEGKQKPELTQEIIVQEEILSCFYNENYIGLIYDNIEGKHAYHIKVMDMRGKTVMENDTNIIYDKIGFLSNNEICVTNATECEIFTIHSIKKFSYTFDKELYQILAKDDSSNYIFVFKDTVEEVGLR